MSEFKDEEASLSVNLSEESEASDSVIFRKIENFTNQPKNESAVSLCCFLLLAWMLQLTIFLHFSTYIRNSKYYGYSFFNIVLFRFKFSNLKFSFNL